MIPSRNGTNTTITLNQRAFRPVVIDELGHLKDLVRNANYTVLGTERYINSGFLLPAGQDKSITGSSNKFTLGFSRPGKYDYFDSFHPLDDRKSCRKINSGLVRYKGERPQPAPISSIIIHILRTNMV